MVFGPAFENDPRIVGFAVRAVEPVDNLHGLVERGLESRHTELVRQCQNQCNQGLLMIRISEQNIQADALGILGFTEQAVALGHGEGGRERFGSRNILHD